jgi:thioredoxin 1
MAINITENNFDDIVLKSEKPVLLDFWAEWCGPCRMIAPIIDELHNEFEGKAVIGKVNVDESSSISSKYGIRNIPTLLFIKNGEVVDKHVGAVSKEDLSEKLSGIL